MAKKRSKPSTELSAKAVAKAEISAKASYQHKKIVSEVIPPDVTRAKAGAWLDLISPITEWAGLKGDVLRHRRQQLRIQQDVALNRLAASINKKMKGRKIEQLIPPKILVPALEAASLEDPNSPLVDWWANLFVTGATGGSVRPYHVDLMKVIGIDEAECLKDVWDRFSRREEYLTGQFDAGANTAHRLIGSFERAFLRVRSDSKDHLEYMRKLLDELNKLRKRVQRNELPVEIEIVECDRDDNHRHRLAFSLPPLIAGSQTSMEVCFALNLLTKHERKIAISANGKAVKCPKEIDPHITVWVYYPSELGVEFMTACQPPNLRVSG